MVYSWAQTTFERMKKKQGTSGAMTRHEDFDRTTWFGARSNLLAHSSVQLGVESVVRKHPGIKSWRMVYDIAEAPQLLESKLGLSATRSRVFGATAEPFGSTKARRKAVGSTLWSNEKHHYRAEQSTLFESVPVSLPQDLEKHSQAVKSRDIKGIS